MDYSFKHLDPSVTRTYRATVLYGFEAKTCCLLLRVKNGYVTETPLYHKNKMEFSWIRGQHITVLKDYFTKIHPVRIISDAY